MLYSFDMNHAPNVGPETIWQDILTEVATVLAASSPVGEQIADLLIKEFPNLQVYIMIGKVQVTESVYQKIHQLLIQAKQSHGYYHRLSMLQPVSALASFIPPPSTNLSSPTMTTKRKNFAVPKPVTFTLTGKLKPNIITEVPPPVSSKSTKVPVGQWFSMDTNGNLL